MARILCNRQRLRYLTWFLVWSLGVLLDGSVVLSQALALPGASATQFECVIEPQQVVKLASPVVGVIAPSERHVWRAPHFAEPSTGTAGRISPACPVF